MFTDDSLLVIISVLIGFLVARVSEYLNAIYRRRKLHYDTLIGLESRLQQISDDIVVAKSRLESIENAWKTSSVSVDNVKLELLDENIFHGLLDLELKNLLFNFLVNARRVLDDLEIIRRGNALVRNRFTGKVISATEYSGAVHQLQTQISPIQSFLDKLDVENTKIIAYLRIRIKRDEPLLSRLGVLKVFKVSTSDIENEVKNLEKERESKKSKR